MTPKQIVMEKHPKAYALEVGSDLPFTRSKERYGFYILKPIRGHLPLALSRKGKTEALAWQSAYERLKEKK